MLNVATPFTAVTVVVPDRMPAPLATDTVTAAEDEGTRRLFTSRISTTGCVVKATVLATPAGCVVTTTRVGGGGEDVSDAVAVASPGDVKLSVKAPVPVTTRSVNVATPATAFTVVVPPNVTAPLATDADTAAVAVGTTFPAASRI